MKFIQGSSLASLINRNTSKEDVEIVNDIQVTNKISDTGNNISGNGNVLLNSLDQIENNYSGNVYLNPVNCKVNSNTNIGGKLTIQSDFDLNGKYLKTGSLEILNGTFDVNGGDLEVSDSMNVEGSYTFDDNERNAIFDVNGGNVVIGGNCSFAGYSHLKMLNAKDNILVNGNFAVNSNIDSENELTNGVLEVKGDFTQAGNSTNFRPTANHRVKLSGKADENNLQKIIPYSSKSLYFNILA